MLLLYPSQHQLDGAPAPSWACRSGPTSATAWACPARTPLTCPTSSGCAQRPPERHRLLPLVPLGYDAVFRRILLLKAGLFLAAGLLAYAYAFVNLAVLRRQIGRAGASRLPASGPWTPVNLPAFPALRAWWLPAAAALAPAAVVGLVAAGSWDTVLHFVWARPFGRVDPVFGHDLGFYLFFLPFLELVQNLLTAASLVAVLALGETYRRAGLLGYRSGTGPRAPRPVRRHLLANAALFLLAWAAGCLLDRYALLAGSSGAVFGAGYTAVNVTRHALAGPAAAT